VCCPPEVTEIHVLTSLDFGPAAAHAFGLKSGIREITNGSNLVFFCMLQQPLVSQGFLVVKDLSDQSDAETSTLRHTSLTTDRHPCPCWDLSPQSKRASNRRLLPYIAGQRDRQQYNVTDVLSTLNNRSPFCVPRILPAGVCITILMILL
jgi:hypothetical protein